MPKTSTFLPVFGIDVQKLGTNVLVFGIESIAYLEQQGKSQSGVRQSETLPRHEALQRG
jgi:hypothetical protein